MTPPALARMSGIDDDAALAQDLVGLRRGRAVRALDDDRGLDRRGVVGVIRPSSAAGTRMSHVELQQRRRS